MARSSPPGPPPAAMMGLAMMVGTCRAARPAGQAKRVTVSKRQRFYHEAGVSQWGVKPRSITWVNGHFIIIGGRRRWACPYAPPRATDTAKPQSPPWQCSPRGRLLNGSSGASTLSSRRFLLVPARFDPACWSPPSTPCASAWRRCPAVFTVVPVRFRFGVSGPFSAVVAGFTADNPVCALRRDSRGTSLLDQPLCQVDAACCWP